MLKSHKERVYATEHSEVNHNPSDLIFFGWTPNEPVHSCYWLIFQFLTCIYSNSVVKFCQNLGANCRVQEQKIKKLANKSCGQVHWESSQKKSSRYD